MRMSREDKAAFMTPEKEAFFRDVAASFVAAGVGKLFSLSVDGVLRARVPAYGAGMLRAAIPPTTVLPGQSVAVTSRGLAIAEIVADGAWGRLMGLTRSTAPWRLQGQRDLTSAVPIYPLPACGGACAPGYGGTIGVTGM